MGALRVLAAMSGGVDSATAAARAVDAGHEVTGVHLALSSNPSSYRTGARGCCTLEDARDARRAADVIGIPFYVWDMAERFSRDVVDDFVAEYAAGRTPNPCLRCNEKIKFSAVLDRALALGFDAVCTGHYARLHDGVLRRAADPGKDQSYVLAVLTADQLAHAMFPLGDTSKEQVRAEAARRGLAVADKPDSHDVCFVADGDTRGFLTRKLGAAPGQIVDQTGTVVGSHDGAFGFTVGQRRGLRIDTPAADGRPRYVLDIEPVTRTVTVGPAEGLDITDITGVRPVWSAGAPPAQLLPAQLLPAQPSSAQELPAQELPAQELPAQELRCLAQLSAHGKPIDCTAWLDDDTLRIRLDRQARGIAKGQAAVLYDADTVLGSATISATSAAA
jgi:tRNA-uridine 2-sulfurtransferase